MVSGRSVSQTRHSVHSIDYVHFSNPLWRQGIRSVNMNQRCWDFFGMSPMVLHCDEEQDSTYSSGLFPLLLLMHTSSFSNSQPPPHNGVKWLSINPKLLNHLTQPSTNILRIHAQYPRKLVLRTRMPSHSTQINDFSLTQRRCHSRTSHNQISRRAEYTFQPKKRKLTISLLLMPLESRDQNTQNHRQYLSNYSNLD